MLLAMLQGRRNVAFVQSLSCAHVQERQLLRSLMEEGPPCNRPTVIYFF